MSDLVSKFLIFYWVTTPNHSGPRWQSFEIRLIKFWTEVLGTHFFADSEGEGWISKSNCELVLQGCLKGGVWGVVKTLKFKTGVRMGLSDPN